MLARPKSDTRDFVCETGFSPLSRSRHAGFYKVLSEIKPGGFMKHLKWLLVSVFAVSLLGACNTSLPETSPENTVVTRGPTVTEIKISASKVAMRESDSSRLIATVTGTRGISTAVTWAIEADDVGSLSSTTGNRIYYYAPRSSFGRVVRITATSVQDPTKFKTIFVSVNPVKASIATRAFHTLALRSDGQVLSWGLDDSGQLGDGMVGPLSNPTPSVVPGASNIVAIAAGNQHSLALKADGTLLSWGLDDSGQLGDGMVGPLSNPTPSVVLGASNIIAIAAGGFHSLALKSDGTILSWGNGGLGQLGNGAATGGFNPTPSAVIEASNIVAIAAGNQHSLALKADGTILSWGYNLEGQLGHGYYDDFIRPIANPFPSAVNNASNIVAIAAGDNHSLALTSDGTTLSWGGGYYQGQGTTGGNNFTPSAVIGASNIVGIAAGYYFSLALKSDGTILSWGEGTLGQLGYPAFGPSAITSAVIGASNIVAIAAGDSLSLALKSDGTLLSWGSDFYGKRGNGTVAVVNSFTPTAVLLGLFTIRLP
jgi:alpha-tubulin suppressor-like RCC1 family protein